MKGNIQVCHLGSKSGVDVSRQIEGGCGLGGTLFDSFGVGEEVQICQIWGKELIFVEKYSYMTYKTISWLIFGRSYVY